MIPLSAPPLHQTVHSIVAADAQMWLGSGGQWLGIMLFRMGGLYSP